MNKKILALILITTVILLSTAIKNCICPSVYDLASSIVDAQWQSPEIEIASIHEQTTEFIHLLDEQTRQQLVSRENSSLFGRTYTQNTRYMQSLLISLRTYRRKKCSDRALIDLNALEALVDKETLGIFFERSIKIYQDVRELYIKRCINTWQELLNWHYYDLPNKNAVLEWLYIVKLYAELNNWISQLPAKLTDLRRHRQHQESLAEEIGASYNNSRTTTHPTSQQSQASTSNSSQQPVIPIIVSEQFLQEVELQQSQLTVDDTFSSIVSDYMDPRRKDELKSLLLESISNEDDPDIRRSKQDAFDRGEGICNHLDSPSTRLFQNGFNYILMHFPDTTSIKDITHSKSPKHFNMYVNPLMHYLFRTMCKNLAKAPIN